MKKANIFFKFPIAFFLISIIVTACADNDENLKTDKILVSPDSWTFDALEKETKEFLITTTAAEWSYDCAEEWLDIEKVDNKLMVTASRNFRTTHRETSIRLYGPTVSDKIISITQDGVDGDIFYTDPEYLWLDFDQEEPVELAVLSTYENWAWNCEATWIDIEQDGEMLYVSAAYNSGGIRETEIVITAAGERLEVKVEQSAWYKRNSYNRYRLRGNFPSAISNNGRYIVGYNEHAGFMWDTENHEADSVHYLSLPVPDNEWIEMMGVSNTGIGIGCYQNMPAMYDYHAKTWTKLDLSALGVDVQNPSTWTGIGYANAISDDGRIIAGYYQTSVFNAMIWEDGVGRVLELPANDHTSQPGLGYAATCMSSDGSVVAGYQYDHCYKTVGAQLYPEFSIHSPELLDYRYSGGSFLVYSYYQPGCVSPNGRYIGGLYREAKGTAYDTQAYVFDRQTGVTELIPEKGVNISYVTNDGTVFYCTPYVAYNRTAYMYKDGVSEKLVYWLEDNYGITLDHIGGTVVDCTPDLKSILGFIYTDGLDIYLIRL